MLNKISNKPTNEPVKPDVKNQAAGKPMPIIKYIDKMNRLYSYDPSAEDPGYIDPKEMEDIKKSLPVSEMVKKEERFNVIK